MSPRSKLLLLFWLGLHCILKFSICFRENRHFYHVCSCCQRTRHTSLQDGVLHELGSLWRITQDVAWLVTDAHGGFSATVLSDLCLSTYRKRYRPYCFDLFLTCCALSFASIMFTHVNDTFPIFACPSTSASKPTLINLMNLIKIRKGQFLK